ncbi:MAG: 6,7-dimethyl-8-ribityllumazine synthase [Actinomycetota bacterium]
MSHNYEGSYDGRNLKVAVIVSRFNETIGKALLEGATDCLRRHNVAEEDITTVWVPGAFEIPAAARRLAGSKEVDAIVTVGAVIRGETAHFDYVAGHAARGVGDVAMEFDIPVTFGVLTTENYQQAVDRAGGKLGNKGFEAALAALEMANLFASLPKSLPEV